MTASFDWSSFRNGGEPSALPHSRRPEPRPDIVHRPLDSGPPRLSLIEKVWRIAIARRSYLT